MTVRELIGELQKLDPNMLVVTGSTEYSDYPSSPNINVRKFDFKSNYWDDDGKIKSIPINQEFLEL